MTDKEKILEYLRGNSNGKIDLRWGNFNSMTLKNAVLPNASLQFTDFIWSDLSKSNLENADISEAYLMFANMKGANLNPHCRTFR